MNLERIRDALSDIARAKCDCELAHGMEDGLFQAFAFHVAENGPPELAEMAREILKVRDIDFPRYCA